MDSIKPLAVGTNGPNKQAQVSLPDMTSLANGMALSVSFSSILGSLFNDNSSQPTTTGSGSQVSVQNTTSAAPQTPNAPQSQQNVNSVPQASGSQQTTNQSQQSAKVVNQDNTNQAQQPAANQQPQQQVINQQPQQVNQQTNQQPQLQVASQNVASVHPQVNMQQPVLAQVANQPIAEAPVQNIGAVLLQVVKPKAQTTNSANTFSNDISSTSQNNVGTSAAQEPNFKQSNIEPSALMNKLNVSQVVVNAGEPMSTQTASSWKMLDNLSTPLSIATSADAKQALQSGDKSDTTNQQINALTGQNPADVLTSMNFASVNYSMSDLSQSFKDAVPQNQANAINATGNVEEVSALGTNSGAASQTSFEGNITQAGVNMQGRIDFIQNLMKAAKSADLNGQSRLKMTLNPPELGSLKVDLAMKDKVLNGSFKVESESAKQLVLSHIGNLKSALEEHGIKMGDFNVNVQQGLEHQSSQSFESQNFNQAQHNPSTDANYWQERKPVDEGVSVGATSRASSRLQVIDVLA